MIRVALFNNQGGQTRMGFYAGIAGNLQKRKPELDSVLVVWTKEEAQLAKDQGVDCILDFESWAESWRPAEEAVNRLNLNYPLVNWAEVIATERSFTDYSLLLGAAGDRHEDADYVWELLARIVGFFEYVFDTFQIQVMMCPTADTLFTLVGFKVARQKGIEAVAESAAWLLPEGMPGGGFLTRDEYMRSAQMIVAYEQLGKTEPTSSELTVAHQMAKAILEFSGKTSFSEKNKGKKAGFSTLTPNFLGLLPYLIKNARRDKRVEYTKFRIGDKVRANVMRFFRRRATERYMGSVSCDALPLKSVFYALHYQPEQSTLTQGVWYANQIALIENISKSLPLGYVLIVKEHPWGRGNRPSWQYRHLARLYNVMFCDAPAKQIISRVEAVVAVAGTIAIESLVMDKPTVLLGRTFFDFSDLFYKVEGIAELPGILREILINRCHEARTDRAFEIDRFLLAYRRALIPAYPVTENSTIFASALIDEIRFRGGLNESQGLHQEAIQNEPQRILLAPSS